jgi:hypothetical protein
MMILRLKATVHGEHCVVKVYRNPETKEFVCKLVGQPTANYFTEDSEDAVNTATAMADHYDRRVNNGTSKST